MNLGPQGLLLVANLELCLARGKSDSLRFVPHGGAVFELDHRLHSAVVVVDVDDANHLGALHVADAQRDLADLVAADQLDDLGGCRELGVDLDG